jgi:hypothetical protein
MHGSTALPVLLTLHRATNNVLHVGVTLAVALQVFDNGETELVIAPRGQSPVPFRKYTLGYFIRSNVDELVGTRTYSATCQSQHGR